MKRCPECRRDYTDETLNYCLDDGAALVDGPSSGSGDMTAIFDGQSVQTSAADTKTKLFDNESAASHPQPTAEFKKGKLRWAALLVAIAAIVMLAGGYLIYRSYTPKRVLISAAPPKITRLTTSGKALQAAVSPDGKWVVYAQKDGGQQSLWLRQIVSNSAIQIVPAADVQIGRQTFSPDGNYVYYFVTNANDPSGVLYQASTIGGPPKKILTGIASPITFSPDGKRIAFIRNDEVTSAEDQLIVANVDGTAEKKLAARSGDTWFSFPCGCSWSPDGKLIACAGGKYKTELNQMVILTDAESGEEKDFSTPVFTDIGRLVWRPDGSGLFANAADTGSEFDQLWFITYPSGESRKITSNLMEYSGPTLTADSESLVSIQIDQTANIWTAPAGDSSHPKQITSGKLEGGVDTGGGVTWAPDGRIVYTSLSSGNADIWIMKKDGTDQKQLTSDAAVDIDPVVSRDGRYIVFASSRTGTTGLWRMDLDGGNMKMLSELDDHKPQISPDSKWIIFDSWRSHKRALWKMPIDGGEAIQLTEKFTSSCGISPDEKSIACFYRDDERAGSPWRIVILPFDGGKSLKTFDASVEGVIPLEASLGWTPDGRAITYVSSTSGIPNLWSQPVDGGAPKKITDFKENGVWRYAWSHDGKDLAFTRGSETSDVVLLKDFK